MKIGHVASLPVLALLFIGFKLAGIIAWSWAWVLAPLWIPFALAAAWVVLILFGAIVLAVAYGVTILCAGGPRI